MIWYQFTNSVPNKKASKAYTHLSKVNLQVIHIVLLFAEYHDDLYQNSMWNIGGTPWEADRYGTHI